EADAGKRDTGTDICELLAGGQLQLLFTLTEVLSLQLAQSGALSPVFRIGQRGLALADLDERIFYEVLKLLHVNEERTLTTKAELNLRLNLFTDAGIRTGRQSGGADGIRNFMTQPRHDAG